MSGVDILLEFNLVKNHKCFAKASLLLPAFEKGRYKNIEKVLDFEILINKQSTPFRIIMKFTYYTDYSDITSKVGKKVKEIPSTEDANNDYDLVNKMIKEKLLHLNILSHELSLNSDI